MLPWLQQHAASPQKPAPVCIYDNSWGYTKGLQLYMSTHANPQLGLQFQQAHMSQAIAANEDSEKALRNLLSFGLVVERLTSIHDSSPNGFAQIIEKMALNVSTQNGGVPCKSPFTLRFGQEQFQVPARSRLFFNAVAVHFQIKVYLFSSRAKSYAITPPGAVYSVGFFHRIDSYFGESEFLVLALSSHPRSLTSAMYTRPAVMRPAVAPPPSSSAQMSQSSAAQPL
ncbi:hypothetical protein BGZ70_005831, partial [Mortierella alpina]